MRTPIPIEGAEAVLPPPDTRTAYRTAATGAILCLGAALIGVLAWAWGDSAPAVLSTLRLALVAIGAILGGYAASQLPASWEVWALSAVGFLLAIPGLPAHWDSARLLASVLCTLTVAGGILAALPLRPRLTVLSVAILYHFGGIFAATTWPDPTPWLTNQFGYRFYYPYLSFLYLKNAYHFYSPEPGPATLLVMLVRYELPNEIDPATGKPKVVHEWQMMPRRDTQFKDPLGQTYYRRLSITEMIAPSIAGLVATGNFENTEAWRRRTRASVVATGGSREPIPITTTDDPPAMQYRIPQAHISRYLLPSYARHIAVANGGPDRTVLTTRLYRMEHRIVPTRDFAAGADPFHPTTYKTYYLGEYRADGSLIDPQDEMLYWMVPVSPKPGGASPDDPERKDYVDYLSKHAGYEFDWRRMRP